jgi:hypothetical protein
MGARLAEGIAGATGGNAYFAREMGLFNTLSLVLHRHSGAQLKAANPESRSRHRASLSGSGAFAPSRNDCEESLARCVFRQDDRSIPSHFCIARVAKSLFSFLSEHTSSSPKFFRAALPKHLVARNPRARIASCSSAEWTMLTDRRAFGFESEFRSWGCKSANQKNCAA